MREDHLQTTGKTKDLLRTILWRKGKRDMSENATAAGQSEALRGSGGWILRVAEASKGRKAALLHQVQR